MTKYKWSFLGLILSIILFLIFLISPLVNLSNKNVIIPAEPAPEKIILAYILYNYPEENRDANQIVEAYEAKRAYQEWYENVPKKFNWSALSVFGKSFYHWNLFWIPIIIFSVLTANYKKEQGKLL